MRAYEGWLQMVLPDPGDEGFTGLTGSSGGLQGSWIVPDGLTEIREHWDPQCRRDWLGGSREGLR